MDIWYDMVLVARLKQDKTAKRVSGVKVSPHQYTWELTTVLPWLDVRQITGINSCSLKYKERSGQVVECLNKHSGSPI